MHDVHEWDLIWRLGLALVLSASIGLDRELRQKSAGLRTYTLVGVGSALFMLISKYGFFDVLAANEVGLAPSRVAAQIVSGIGFLGAGLIFVRRDSVRGLTTAAGVWLTAAVGAAAGASLAVLAIAPTGALPSPPLGPPPRCPGPCPPRPTRPPRCGSSTRTAAASSARSSRPAPRATSRSPTSTSIAVRTLASTSPSRSRSTAAATSPTSPPTLAR